MKPVLSAVLLLALAIPSLSHARWFGRPVPIAHSPIVDVRIIGDTLGDMRQYRTYPKGSASAEYYYLEASRGERYSLQVTNRTAGRIGVVIAVDGRNIISGEKSILQPSERMYIVEPYGTYRYEGWRTAMDKTNRFYFTEQSDSYAERAFSDGSAMGTIAVAVFRENVPVDVPAVKRGGMPESESSALPAPSQSRDTAFKAQSAPQPGTGFGESTYSPIRIVQFDPIRTVAQKIILKYEWRSELCKKGIVSCGTGNRLWPSDDGFAPAPDDRYQG